MPQNYDVGFSTQKGTEVLAVPLPETLGERGQKVTEPAEESTGSNAPQHVKTFLSGGNKSPSVASSRHKENPGRIARTENIKHCVLRR